MKYYLAVAVLVSVAILSVSAQQSGNLSTNTSSSPFAVQPSDQEGTYSLKVTTTLVSLDVVVTDANGKPVDNLKKSDFTILEDKTPQTILNFDSPSLHFFPENVSVNSTAELDREEPNAPVTIIVLDELDTSFEDEAFMRYSMLKYLKAQPEHLTQPTELVAVSLDGMKVLRDYTTSKQEIQNALKHHLQALPIEDNHGVQVDQFSQAFLALDQVAKATAGHLGHKNMIWIGHGIPVVHMEDVSPDDWQALQSAIETCANELRDARVTLYTIDPSGIAVDVTYSGENAEIREDPFGENVDFNAMAQATGGMALFGRNDLDNLIRQSVTDGNHFYTLTYSPKSDRTPQNFRSIRILVDRFGMTATTRQGYYAKPTDMAPALTSASQENKDDGIQLLAASGNNMVYDGLPMSVEQVPGNPGRFILHLDPAGLRWQNPPSGQPATRLALLVVGFDGKGEVVFRNAKVLQLQGSVLEAGEPAHDSGLNLIISVNAALPLERLRFILRSSLSGKMGAVNLYCTRGQCKP